MRGAGCGVQGAGCRVQGAGCRVQGVGCRVQGGSAPDVEGERVSVDQEDRESRFTVVYYTLSWNIIY